MASRKHQPEPQGALSLFGFNREPDPPRLADVKPTPEQIEKSLDVGPTATKLRLAYSRPNEDVEIVDEPHGGYWVQRRRKNGTIFAAVHYTRNELEMFVRVAKKALEVTDEPR